MGLSQGSRVIDGISHSAAAASSYAVAKCAISLCLANAVIDLNTGCYRGYDFSDTSISIPGDEVYENITLWSLSIFLVPCSCILLPDMKLCQPLFVCRIRFIIDAIPLVESGQNSFSW
ncbi:hypothetical protein POPTR_003G214400v4 [Populus trichocarpa]|uniref:Uncharacterized protein n=1 Tax=Populus trichocarpa TaxID=3694 RepID=A0A2K2BAI2_POPTR|nr:hypothetical protein BDE02_03G197100 [Populus trichocarpa]PNT46793.1 hypothetical protein POPTR_003G214400v4 [Populus trichocarpa]